MVKQSIKEKLSYDVLYNKFIINNERLVDIANEYNISRDTLMRLLKEYNIKKDKKQAFELTVKTMNDRYGVGNPMQNKDIRKKAENTCIEKYGAKSILLSDEYLSNHKKNINQIKSTYIKNNIPFENYEIFKSRESAIKYLTENNLVGLTMKEISDYTKYAYNTIVEIINELDLHDYVKYVGGSSYYEKEIINYIKSLGITNIIERDKKILNGNELDIYIPDKNVAIEFNGNYWHSSLYKDKKYHYNKSIECEKLGIRLIHIYQYEWDDERTKSIIKSLLKISLGKAEKRIYARNCIIKEISNSTARFFNEKNHIQNHRNAQITYGLFYNDELVQLMSFSKHTKYEWEIVRGCPGSNNTVVGGVGKLFKYFIKENKPSEIFSYCDFNKFDGKSYEAIGMKLIGITGPDKTYIINKKAVKRNPRKRDEYDKAAECIIWGSGSKKYLWKAE